MGLFSGQLGLNALGRAGSDPEMRLTPTGTEVTNFSIACDLPHKRNDEWIEETTWVRVACWGSVAKAVDKVLKKGMWVGIYGAEPKLNVYVDKNGTARGQIEVSIWNFGQIHIFTGARGAVPAGDSEMPEEVDQSMASLDSLPF